MIANYEWPYEVLSIYRMYFLHSFSFVLYNTELIYAACSISCNCHCGTTVAWPEWENVDRPTKDVHKWRLMWRVQDTSNRYCHARVRVSRALIWSFCITKQETFLLVLIFVFTQLQMRGRSTRISFKRRFLFV